MPVKKPDLGRAVRTGAGAKRLGAVHQGQRLAAGGDIAEGQGVTLPHPLVRIHKHADSVRRRVPGEQSTMRLVDEVFARLPAECQSLVRRFRAQSYLSLFRSAWRLDHRAEARRYYLCALKLSPAQALRWRYLGKLLRLSLHIRSRNRS